MKRCRNCNSLVKYGSSFCAQCGSSSLETVSTPLDEENKKDAQKSPEKDVVVQYVVKDRSFKESIEHFRQKVVDLLNSYRVTEVLLEWSAFLMCVGPAYSILANFPELGLYSATVVDWLSIAYIIGFLLSLVELKHGAFAFLFAIRGIDSFIGEIVRFSAALERAETYNLELSNVYSLSGDTVGTWIFLTILFGIAYSNYKKEKSGY